MMKHLRQQSILALTEREDITSQRLLQRRLRSRGFNVTQATLSRDIRELGLVKRAADGVYESLAPEMKRRQPAERQDALRRAVATHVRRLVRVREFLLLHTNPGEAAVLAREIDRADISGMAGTIAGNDTVLAACTTVAGARRLLGSFVRWAK